jgi:hypothetical protein
VGGAGVIEKPPQDRKPPSEGYMKAWLEKHPEKVSTGATFSLKPSEALVSAARLQDQINEARARTAYNNEKKVLAVQARRVQVRKEALARLQGKLASGVGQPDKGLALERAFAGCATSGLVSWKVFVAALKSVGVTSLTEEELSTLMAEFDANADGGLEYKEFLRTYVADYAHLGLDGALLEDFSRTTGFIQKTKQELAVRITTSRHTGSGCRHRPPFTHVVVVQRRSQPLIRQPADAPFTLRNGEYR